MNERSVLKILRLCLCVLRVFSMLLLHAQDFHASEQNAKNSELFQLAAAAVCDFAFAFTNRAIVPQLSLPD